MRNIIVINFKEDPLCPVYRQITTSKITVHGRKASDKNRQIKIGDTILLYVQVNGIAKTVLDIKVVNIKKYADIEEFVIAEGLNNIIGDRTKCMNIKNESEYIKYYYNMLAEKSGKSVEDIRKEIRIYKEKYGYGFIGFDIEFVHEFKFFRKIIKEPLLSQIKLGEKSVIVEVNKDWAEELKLYDRIIMINEDNPNENISVYVLHIRKYDNIPDLVRNEEINKILSNVKTNLEAVKLLEKMYSTTEIKKYGEIAIHVITSERYFSDDL